VALQDVGEIFFEFRVRADGISEELVILFGRIPSPTLHYILLGRARRPVHLIRKGVKGLKGREMGGERNACTLQRIGLLIRQEFAVTIWIPQRFDVRSHYGVVVVSGVTATVVSVTGAVATVVSVVGVEEDVSVDVGAGALTTGVDDALASVIPDEGFVVGGVDVLVVSGVEDAVPEVGAGEAGAELP
jgi:hypothetical protein